MKPSRLLSAALILSTGLGFGVVTQACGGSSTTADDGDEKDTPEAVTKDYCDALCECFGNEGDDDRGDDGDGINLTGGGACDESQLSSCEDGLGAVFESTDDACIQQAYVDYLRCLADGGECSYCDEGPCLEDPACGDAFVEDYNRCGGGAGGGSPFPTGSTTTGPDYCPFTNDGFCDEPDSCPPGTDTADCSASCPFTNDGYCDEPNSCPPGTDVADCQCPYTNDGHCDEPGVCAPGTDVVDCSGPCPYTNDGYCDEPGTCPPGTDVVDCQCPYTNDGYCDEPNSCPPGTDVADCQCLSTNDGNCDEPDTCPPGTDVVDCQCPYTNDGHCDEPDDCPPGTDTVDCSVPPTPCGAECAGDPGCDEVPADPGGACSSCVQEEADAQSSCAIDATFGDDCQDDADCAEYVNCVLAGETTCDDDYPDGAALAIALVLEACGGCGDGSI